MTLRPKPFQPIKMLQIIGGVFFAYLFFGFMLLPCLNTLTSIFTVRNAAGEIDPLAVTRFFLYFAQQTVLRAFRPFCMSSDTDPFIMINVIFLFDPVKHQIFVIFFDIT